MSVPDGAYLKIGTGLKADTTNLVTGYCDWYAWGSFYGREQRNINYAKISSKPPSDYSTNPPTDRPWGDAFVSNYTPAQTLNSRLPSSSGSVSLDSSYLGQYIVRFQTIAMATQCQIPTDGDVAQSTYGVVACLPNWVKDGPRGETGNPILPQFPQDQSPIRIAYPSSLDTEVRGALNGWTTMLRTFGLSNLVFQYDADGLCAQSDAHCVEIAPDAQLLAQYCDPGACGCAQASGVINNVYTARTRVILDPTYATSTYATFSQWLLAHELGHLLGLNHVAEDPGPTKVCARGVSVMIPTARSCGQVGTDATTAQTSDALPVAKTVYGGGSVKTCGW